MMPVLYDIFLHTGGRTQRPARRLEMCPCAYMGYIGGASKTDAPFPKVGTGLLCAIKVVLFHPEFFHMLKGISVFF